MSDRGRHAGEYKVQPGDVFVEQWGYDQSNVDCYVVTRRTPKSVAIKPCGREVINGRVKPDPEKIGEFRTNRTGKPATNGEVIKRLTTGWRGEPYLSMTSYSGASIWDGEQTYYDTLAAGQPGH